jgi:hypothetical protein
MFFHLGGDIVVPAKQVVAIYDLDRTTVSADTRAFLAEAERRGLVTAVDGELPKAFVMTDGVEGGRVWLSPMSSATLMKRLSRIKTEPDGNRGR